MTSLGLLQYSEINDNSGINSLTDIEKKKQTRHNITIKKRNDGGANNSVNGSANSENVQNMLKLINNSNGYENDDSTGLADFNPPPRAEVSTKSPTSDTINIDETIAQNTKNLNIDVEKPTIVLQRNEENIQNMTEVKPRQYPPPLDNYEGFNASPKYASDYYKQYVPYFNQPGNQNMNKGQILEKLNYMIHLLEEQKDEKTGHVMEEVILYSFLGVFIIFIIDSFARVGKYTR
jgi:hypothetical protein